MLLPTIINILDLRKKSLEMLIEVTNTLKDHNVFFWLDFGSLLGAMRSGRSIVWDGDYDLSIFEKDFSEDAEVWNILRAKKYNVKINKNNIKITQKHWKLGYYIIDIHRIKRINENLYCYYYGNIYTPKIQLIQSILDIIEVLISKHETYIEFYIITSFLLKNGVNPDDLERLDNFEFIDGKINSPIDFTIKNDYYNLTSSYYKAISKKNKVIYLAFLIMNRRLLKYIAKLIKKFLKQKKKQPLMVFEILSGYLNSFSKIVFHNIEFHIPNDSEKYLESLFGPLWRIPKLGHWRHEEGKASGVKKY